VNFKGNFITLHVEYKRKFLGD